MTISLEIVNFDVAMAEVREEVNRLANAEIDRRVMFAIETLRRVTPVDTGEARSGWRMTRIPELDGTVGYIIENPVEHIIYLNRGHSRQAPAYFIEQVLSTIGLIGSPI